MPDAGTPYPGTGATSLGGASTSSDPRQPWHDPSPTHQARAAIGRRALAAAIDWSLFLVPAAVALGIVVAGPTRQAICVSRGLDGTESSEVCTIPTAGATVAIVVLLVVGVVAWAASVLVLQIRRGASLGRSVAGLRVLAAETGAPATAGAIVVRELTRGALVVVGLGVLGVVDHLVALARADARTLHDLLARTRVAHEGDTP